MPSNDLGSTFSSFESHSAFNSFINWVLKSIPLPKFVVIVLRFVSLLQVQIVVWEKVIVVLWSHYLFWVIVFSLVWVKETRLVLPKLVIVVFVIEVLVGPVVPPIRRLSEIVDHFLEPCRCFLVFLGILHWHVGNVNIQLLDLLADIIHSLLDVSLFSIGWEIQWFEGRKCL